MLRASLAPSCRLIDRLRSISAATLRLSLIAILSANNNADDADDADDNDNNDDAKDDGGQESQLCGAAKAHERRRVRNANICATGGGGGVMSDNKRQSIDYKPKIEASPIR